MQIKIVERFQFLDPGPLSDGDLTIELAKRVRGNRQRGIVPAYRFDIHVKGHEEPVGSISLKTRLTPKLMKYGGHLGYEVKQPYRGHHYALRAIRLLLPFAYRHGINTLLITCDEENHASRRVAQRAGAKLKSIGLAERDVGEPVSTCYYEITLIDEEWSSNQTMESAFSGTSEK